jgi:hypothetical protein
MHNVIDQSMNVGHQDVTLVTILSIEGKKIRITIKSDSIKKQCAAYSEVWSESNLCWNRVYNLHFSQMKTMSKLVHSNKVDNKNFVQDYLALLSLTKSIIF